MSDHFLGAVNILNEQQCVDDLADGAVPNRKVHNTGVRYLTIVQAEEVSIVGDQNPTTIQ